MGRFCEARDHRIRPAKCKATPAAEQAARVGSMPILKRKIAIAAANESANAQGSMLASTGISKFSSSDWVNDPPVGREEI